MKSDLTDITLVVDRSGSMHEIRQDAEGGVNAFIENQAKEPGEALLTLVQFDTVYEFLHKGVPIQNVKQYKLVPRGATALLDAVGRAINETGERLAKMKDQDRPGLVIFVIMTDGHENSSVEFTRPQIKQMIQEQQDKYNWHFNFLGADQDTFAEAHSMGIDTAHAAQFTCGRVAGTYGIMSAKVGRMRKQAMAGEEVKNLFTNEEREQMK